MTTRAATTLIGVSMLAACAAQPAVEAERSDAIVPGLDLTGVENLSDDLPPSPSNTLPPVDDWPTVETLPTLEDPEWEAMEEDDRMEDDDSMEWDDPIQFEEVDSELEAEMLALLPQGDTLGEPWWPSGDPYVRPGYTEYEYQTDCDPASRIVDHGRHDSATLTWDGNEALIYLQVLAMSDASEVEEAMIDISTLHVECPTFAWTAYGEMYTVEEPRPSVDGVAHASWTDAYGYSEQFVAHPHGRFLIVAIGVDWTDDADRDELNAALDVLAAEMVAIDSGTSTADPDQDLDPPESDRTLEIDPLLTQADLGPNWTVAESDLGTDAYVASETIDPDACGLAQIPNFLDAALDDRFTELSRPSDGLVGEHLVAVFDSPDEADLAMTNLALTDRCAAEAFSSEETQIIYAILDIDDADRAVDLFVDAYGNESRYIVVRVGANVSLTWMSDSDLVSSGDVAWIANATTARLVAS